MSLLELFCDVDFYSIYNLKPSVARETSKQHSSGDIDGGYCAAKKEKFFGWRLHLICTLDGIPVSFDPLPASEQDLTPIHELTVGLPKGSAVFSDKGHVSDPHADSILSTIGLRFVAVRRRNMTPNSWADEYDLRHYRGALKRSIVNSRLWECNIFTRVPITVLI